MSTKILFYSILYLAVLVASSKPLSVQNKHEGILIFFKLVHYLKIHVEAEFHYSSLLCKIKRSFMHDLLSVEIIIRLSEFIKSKK